MKKLLGTVLLVLLFCSSVSAKEYSCFQEGNRKNKIEINVKPLFGLKKSYSNIEIENLPKELVKTGDISAEPFKWAEVLFSPDEKLYNTLIFEFYKEGVVTETNPLKPYELSTSYKSERLVLKMNKRKTPLWDMNMYANPDKEIYFDVCNPK
tara:strand:+ start:339 stop:794 length:456 start_codon:yes stop_codon:yes gene_type:complete